MTALARLLASSAGLLTVQNRVEVHHKRTCDLMPFSPRRVPKVCQSKDQKQTAKVLYLV
jgi:hypothetical protein